MTKKKEGKPAPYGGVKGVADMLNLLDSATRDRLLAGVAAKDPGLADKIREKMIAFEDITRLEPKSAQILIRALPEDLIVLALRNAPEEIISFFLNNMSEKKSQILKENIISQGPRRLSEIEAARSKILELFKTMVSSGKIVFD